MSVRMEVSGDTKRDTWSKKRTEISDCRVTFVTEKYSWINSNPCNQTEVSKLSPIFLKSFLSEYPYPSNVPMRTIWPTIHYHRTILPTGVHRQYNSVHAHVYIQPFDTDKTKLEPSQSQVWSYQGTLASCHGPVKIEGLHYVSMRTCDVIHRYMSALWEESDSRLIYSLFAWT